MKQAPIRHFTLWLALMLPLSCSEKATPPMASPPPATPKIAPPTGPSWKGEWSKVVQSYPGFPLIAGEEREWSHYEIAQRHQSLMMKELPTYITGLRGSGAIKETDSTNARWLFTVPKKRIPDFEQYLADLSIPREAFHEENVTIPSDWIWDGLGNTAPPPPPNPPATKVVFFKSDPHKNDVEILGMKFPHAGASSFSLINPNLARANILIIFNFTNGNAFVMERTQTPKRDEE